MWRMLLLCCLRASLAQESRVPAKRNIWEEPIQFLTKGTKDACSLSVTGQGEQTNLRISCQGRQRSYWCDYRGRPQLCRSYSHQPHHFFKQIMWDLRKLPNACQGRRVLKSIMCRRAGDHAQMVFAASSSPDAVPRDGPSEPQEPRRDQRPTQTQLQILRARLAQAQDHSSPPRTTKHRKTTTVRPPVATPTLPEVLSESRRLAQEYCWSSVQGMCSFFIGWFKN